MRFSSLAASLHRLDFAKSYLIHLAAVLNERLRLRLCPAAPHGSRVPAAALLSIMQRAQPAISLSMQFNAADVAAASHLPRLLHPSTCLADSLSAPASPRLLQRPAAAAARQPFGSSLASFASILSSFMSSNRQLPSLSFSHHPSQ